MFTLWYGGPIYTMTEEGHQVEAILTENDKIIATGNIQEFEIKYKITKRINLNGQTLLPGFVDSHLHLIGHGEKLIRLDLSRYRSKREVLEAVKNYAESVAGGEWVIGEGWNENLWEEAEPIVRSDIDAVVSNHPVLLKRICRHALVVNSCALEEASIVEGKEYQVEGVIGKDKDGALNGIFKEEAQSLVLDAVPKATNSYLKRALRTAIRDAHSHGLTGGHTEDLSYYNGFGPTYNIFREVIEEEGTHFRAHLLVHHKVMDDFQKAGGHFLKGNEWIEFGAIKIFTDGSLGGRTALLSHPYADDLTTNGVAIFSQEELNALVAKVRELRMPIAVHAIGDLAFEMTLQAIEENPLNVPGKDRLIHAQILRRDLIDRAKKLPIILDLQPSFVASDFPWVTDRIGESRMKYCYAWKTLLEENLHCAGGSDAPIEDISPLLGIHAAVTRTSPTDENQIAYRPEEALSIYEAVCLYTKGSAFAACHGEDRGMIKEGFLADFTILDRDIFGCRPDELLKIKVEKTVIGGEMVYSRKETV
ncbi:amidohydrolase [Robertmurraya andreesenii]|uniref:Amidohydrolase YtcJ n=1 Tax=Anoxybacillus andreesenii TaxID=1325932 RepID=A0ABT9V6C3_9BACL|nr:amidohydrolase [Robertmurraya andreesenii]MDQ0156500.1 putative amidohydrolase YtcJ [Robertmurraya andreesenii]